MEVRLLSPALTMRRDADPIQVRYSATVNEYNSIIGGGGFSSYELCSHAESTGEKRVVFTFARTPRGVACCRTFERIARAQGLDIEIGEMNGGPVFPPRNDK